MKITTVSLSRTIPTGPYENVKIGMEGTLDEGENYGDALDKLQRLINAWYINEYPLNEPTKIPEQLKNIASPSPYPQLQTPAIDYKLRDELEAAIEECTTLEGLANLKEHAGKQGLVSQYMKKLNQLTVK